MRFEEFESLVGHGSYIRCKEKLRQDSAIVDYEVAAKHIQNGGQIGWWIRPEYIVVDIDEGKEQALKIVKALGLKTLMCQTPKGLHLYFKTHKDFPQKVGMVLPCGLKCDFRCAQKGYVLLPFGSNDLGRKFNKQQKVADLPLEFTPMVGCKESLYGLVDGDGRNDILLRHLSAYKKRGANEEHITTMADIINQYAFDEPLDAKELQKIVDSTRKYEVATASETPPPELETITARELYKKDIPALNFYVEGILPQGLAILAAPSKFGKSFFCLDLVLSVAAGELFLGRQTTKSHTLYLALEDSHRRIKSRMGLILGEKNPPKGVHFAIVARTIDQGLAAQIKQYMKAYPQTGVIVIDVFQRVRPNKQSRGNNPYAIDYDDMGVLKNIADEHQIVILLVHHTRKMKDDSDEYNQISGSTGIMGAADTILMITKKRREEEHAVLKVIGRDVEFDDTTIKLDFSQSYRWQIVNTLEDEENQRLREYENDPCVKAIRELLIESPNGIELTATELRANLKRLTGVDMSAKTIGHNLRKISKNLLDIDGIEHRRTGNTKCKTRSFRKTRIMIDGNSESVL